jgi:hypothetical protein
MWVTKELLAAQFIFIASHCMPQLSLKYKAPAQPMENYEGGKVNK